MTPEELAALIAAHGGQIGAVPIDPTTKDENGVPTRNYSPQYKLTLRDGTTLTVRPQADWDDRQNAWHVKGWEVTNPGTAVKDQPAKEGAWTLKEVGGRTYRVNAKTGEATPVADMPDAPAKAQAPQLLDKSGGEYITFLNPDGTLGKISNPNWVDEWARNAQARQADLAYKNALTANTGASTALAREKFNWDIAQEPIKQAQAMEAARLQREAQDEQNRRTAAASLFSSLGSTWAQALPRQIGPNQVYHMGFEPGGIAEAMARRTGTTYNPDVLGRINRVEYDPEEDAKRAWRMANGWSQDQGGQ